MSVPRSPRERPAKPALSRAWIVAETIEIMRAEGLEKVTMRRLAQALDTGPASLYVYFNSLTELHAAVVDELLGTLDPAPGGGAASRLNALLNEYTRVMFTYPGLARSALLIRASGPNAVQLYDQLLGLLIATGIEPRRAAWGVDLLLQHITATAAEHTGARPGDPAAGLSASDTALATLTEAIRAADPALTPFVAEHADALLGGPPAERARWAVRAILAGIASTPTPSSPPRS